MKTVKKKRYRDTHCGVTFMLTKAQHVKVRKASERTGIDVAKVARAAVLRKFKVAS